MPIENDEELRQAIVLVDDLVESIQKYCGRRECEDEIPSRSDANYGKLPGTPAALFGSGKKSNCAYGFMFWTFCGG